MTDREKALQVWLASPTGTVPYKFEHKAFLAGYDSRDAQVEALRARLGSVQDGVAAIANALDVVVFSRMLPTKLRPGIRNVVLQLRALLSSAPTPAAETEAKP